MNTPGKTAEFDHGVFTTSDPEIIEFLRNDRSYGIDYFENQDDLSATVNPAVASSAEGEELEVTRPRTRAGQRAGVKAKPTTAADVDDEAAAEGADSSDEE
uniref:Uncharacterized protein n=1 Tax=Eiseniibacteriota bacterium TaxID=2212470 RepID=A0A832I0G2_UNCEI